MEKIFIKFFREIDLLHYFTSFFLCLRSYKRTKRQGLREARATEKLEKQQRLEAERKRRQKHQDYLTAALNHGREMMNFHKNNQAKIQKLNRC